jgi:hypothetical protein
MVAPGHQKWPDVLHRALPSQLHMRQGSLTAGHRHEEMTELVIYQRVYSNDLQRRLVKSRMPETFDQNPHSWRAWMHAEKENRSSYGLPLHELRMSCVLVFGTSCRVGHRCKKDSKGAVTLTLAPNP